MEMSMERDSSALGSLFQQIINDMKNTSPLWEDFVAKASKLHACLRAAIQAIAAYLDAFQKIADAATNSRGASKEIGTALTRVCLRHKAVETRLKTFTAAIMDCLVQPLQDKLEDWKRSVATIDKEHAKEYKRCRTELKKRSTDTLRLQKKARKGQSDTLQSLMDSHMQDVTLRRAELEEVEKKSLRSAMIEERMRYCSFVHMLQPVVKEECEVMSELGHLQEAMQSIALVTKEPQVLPAASEELIHDAKASITLYPESPSASAGGGGSLSQGGCSNSLGSRKSSVCSISSMNSSGSSNSPGHPHYPRSLSQLISPSIRLKPGESSDSGFCSSPALTTQASSINNPSHAVTTWPTHSQDTVDLPSNASERPHTISSAYEKGHQRPPLTVYTFQNPETIHEAGGGVNAAAINNGSGGGGSSSGQNTPSTQKSPAGALTRPPLPVRCSSLERPLSANNSRGNGTNLMQRQCPSPIPAHVTKELSAHLAQQQHQQQLLLQQQQQPNHQQTSPPTYVNMSELANMAAMKITNQQQQQLQQQQQQSPTIHQQQQMLQQQHSIDSISSIHSNDSSASMHLNQSQQLQHVQTTPPSHHQQQSTRSHSSNSNTPSLHSHPSIESTVATPPIGQTPSASSGSSTPQNHYSPLLTNSPSSTAAGTPSGASITSSGLTTSGAAGGTNSGNNFMYNVCSPTPPQSANSSQASDILKITESDGNNGIVVAPSPLTSQTNDSNAYSSNSANNQEISNSNTDADSSGNVVENDERSRASVLQKASMFEKQAAAVKSTPTPPAIASCSMSRNSVAVAANIDNSTNAGIYGTRTSNQSQHQQQQSQSIDPQEVGSTRIARRSSVNTAKPPPPVRRSSSVTPSPNTPTTPTNSNAINMLHQQQAHSLNTSTENLPPPPAYLLDARQTTPTSPPSVMPNSSQKVSETVKALSGLRHQPASPHTLRRLQQQQQQQQQQHQPQSMLQPPKQYQHQYTKSSPVLLSPPTTKRTMPTPLSPQSPLQTDLDEIPPPLPPPNPNQTPHHHHQHQLSLPLRYQQQLPTPTMTAHSNNNHMPPQQQLQHHQQQQLQHQYQDHQQLDYNNGEAIYGTNSPTSFRTSSPGGGIYAQPKILNNMSSFRTNSPGPNGHQTPTQSHVPAQPKTNPNLIAQLNARLNSKQPSSNEAIYGVSSINHQQQREEIYMRNYQQLTPHASQPPPPQQQQQQQQTYDAAETNANATFNTNQNQYSSSQYYAPKHLTAAHQQQPTQQHVQKVANATNNQPSRQLHQSMPMSQSPLPPPELAAQQSHYQTGHQHQPQQQREPIHHTAQHYTCPPPLEDPPPPPIYINNNSATMPKRGASSHHNHHHQQPANLATYAAASSVSTLPKNMIQQQRLQQQQQQQLQLQQQQQAIYGTHQAQQQQYHAPGAITSAHQQAQQYQNPQHISQRPPMPLPHHQQQQQQQQQQSSSTGNRHKAATVNIKQPPVPSRHSSVQQKIFVATNPFIQTTTIHCHSPTASSVHSQPASPICSSPTPSSVASIYGTSSRRSSGSGGGNSGGVGMAQYDVGGGGNAGQVYYNHQLNTATNTNYTSTNVDKNASIRTKTKAEFLENLNAKLAKQSLSGRAFAVRNLINSKALPDPRICHESLMDQIKRGAPLKRNQKINDRSAPKIY
ncbi:probable serine/threonine-protein kinase yakA isoform X13 [Calliphora vicina]|uniref:probable serine/threonine-protein kinase yakA isoform X13 n=1 Tax=Calliphora vicina TaxID=7373 RepID=UPI00325B07E1